MLGGVGGGGSNAPAYPIGNLAWLGQAANSSDSSNQQRKKEVAILALDAVLAEYGGDRRFSNPIPMLALATA